MNLSQNTVLKKKEKKRDSGCKVCVYIMHGSFSDFYLGEM